uniref:Uncharacterized protein n=1 Tax=Arion vulgaris TaxID=1028688 RepID=A0A0B7BBH7_9EUPU
MSTTKQVGRSAESNNLLNGLSFMSMNSLISIHRIASAFFLDLTSTFHYFIAILGFNILKKFLKLMMVQTS